MHGRNGVEVVGCSTKSRPREACLDRFRLVSVQVVKTKQTRAFAVGKEIRPSVRSSVESKSSRWFRVVKFVATSSNWCSIGLPPRRHKSCAGSFSPFVVVVVTIQEAIHVVRRAGEENEQEFSARKFQINTVRTRSSLSPSPVRQGCRHLVNPFSTTFSTRIKDVI